jgi:hypothetical protein
MATANDTKDATTPSTTEATSSSARKSSSTAKKSTAEKSTAKKSTAKKSTAKTSTPKKSSAARKPAPSAPRLHEREPKVIVLDATYATAGIATEVISRVKGLPARIEAVRTDLPQRLEQTLDGLRDVPTGAGPDRAKAAGGELKAKVRSQRVQVEAQVRDLRTKAERELDARRQKVTRELDDRIRTFESSFDQRAEEGRRVTAELQKDQRVARAEEQLKRVLEQTDNTRSQIRAALTSVKRTTEVAREAATKQAETAKSQVKAATTSVKKSAGAVLDAGKELIS